MRNLLLLLGWLSFQVSAGFSQEMKSPATLAAMAGVWEADSFVNEHWGQIGLEVNLRYRKSDDLTLLASGRVYESEASEKSGNHWETTLVDDHLRMRTEAREWDVSFDVESRAWCGIVIEKGIARWIRLERPRRSGNPLVGDWAPRPPIEFYEDRHACLHIVQRASGTLALWMDRNSGWERSYGQTWAVGLTNDDVLFQEFLNGFRPSVVFSGSLSESDRVITGHWSRSIQIPSSFVKVDTGPCSLAR